MTEKEKFLEWVAAEREKGLIDINITKNPDAPACAEEELYAELNRMIEAKGEPPDMDLW